MPKVAIIFILLYYLILKPLRVLALSSNESARLYSDNELEPRFKYIFEVLLTTISISLSLLHSLCKTWREYEHIHMLFWLGKDLSWSVRNPYTWTVFFTFAIALSLDFIYTTFVTKVSGFVYIICSLLYILIGSFLFQRLMIRCTHYIAQLIWILGIRLSFFKGYRED